MPPASASGMSPSLRINSSERGRTRAIHPGPIAAGAKQDGFLTAPRNETITHTSTFDEFTETATLPTRMLYSTPNNSTVQKLVRSDIGTPSYTRAPGEAPGTFALEVAMDELAHKLKLDPVQAAGPSCAQLRRMSSCPCQKVADQLVMRGCLRRHRDHDADLAALGSRSQ